ncbi:transposase-like protein [Streptomyces sp. V1I6]|nr:transposase-like protein [Streptomyces sp. V1I6]
MLMLVCDGLKGLPEAVETVWPRTIVQTCVVHLLRNSFRYAARQDWDKIAKLLKPVYTAPTEEAALERFAEFADAWGRKYPAIVKLWENAWEEFTPFLRFDTEIRRIVCTTNAIESVNARIRRAVKARGHFPNEQAALKCVYMAIMSLDPTGKGQARWTMRWKTALNASTSPSTAACRQPASNLNCRSYTDRLTDPTYTSVATQGAVRSSGSSRRCRR